MRCEYVHLLVHDVCVFLNAKFLYVNIGLLIGRALHYVSSEYVYLLVHLLVHDLCECVFECQVFMSVGSVVFYVLVNFLLVS